MTNGARVGPHEGRAHMRALLVGAAGLSLTMLSYLIDSRVPSLALLSVGLILKASAIVLFFATGKASEQDYREGK
jgi:hypothetical protein